MCKTATFICLLAAFAAVALGVICHSTGFGPPLAVWVACFLAAFGLGKGLVAMDKLVALKAVPGGGPDPRADFANPAIFWAYIVTKFMVLTVAWFVAGYLLGHPGALTLPR